MTRVPASRSLAIPVPPPDWRVLYEALGERVFRLLHRMTGDPALAEDLTHDTFLRVHDGAHQFGARGDVAAWVYRIAGNLGRDELRRRATRERHLVLVPPAVSTARDLDLTLTLQSALDQLDPEHRAVVLLHDVDGFSHAEIADMLDIAEGSSRARLSRARHVLRLVLDPLGHGPRS